MKEKFRLFCIKLQGAITSAWINREEIWRVIKSYTLITYKLMDKWDISLFAIAGLAILTALFTGNIFGIVLWVCILILKLETLGCEIYYLINILRASTMDEEIKEKLKMVVEISKEDFTETDIPPPSDTVC